MIQILKDPNDIYLTSDQHFNHDQDFIWAPRGFKNVHEMNETEFDGWNNTVRPESLILCAGDLCLGADADYVRKTVANLNGEIWLFKGNHDTCAKMKLYEEAPNVKRIFDENQVELDIQGVTFVIGHYPPGYIPEFRGKIYIHGHTHSPEKFKPYSPWVYNVNVDAHNNKPVLLKTIIEDMKMAGNKDLVELASKIRF